VKMFLTKDILRQDRRAWDWKRGPFERKGLNRIPSLFWFPVKAAPQRVKV